MIELRHISKQYKTVSGVNHVLSDINVRFPAGVSVGILGKNGAGKSTLLRIIGGAESADSGDVIRRGRVSWPIGFSGGFSPSLSGEENCRFVARVYDQDIDRVVDEAREFADIGDYFYMPIRTFSSGMKARLAFGLSMAIDFNVYLVDEVTAVGDADFKAKCHAAFQARQKHSSLIMVSHSLSTIKQYCQACAVLTRGQLRLYDNVHDGIEAYKTGALHEQAV